MPTVGILTAASMTQLPRVREGDKPRYPRQQDGRGTIWTLSGKRNDFEDLRGGAAVGFLGQHEARFGESKEEITLFDNHALANIVRCTANYSRGTHVR